MLLDPDVGDAEVRARLLSPVPETTLREDQTDLANWTRFEQIAERHVGLSQFAAPFLTRMTFVDEPGEGTSPTRAARRVSREHRAAGRRGLPPDAPRDFAPTARQPLIRSNGVTDRRRWARAVFLKVRDEIQTGNLAIDGAKHVGRFEAFFRPSAPWEQVRDAVWARTGFPVDPDAAVEQLTARLSDAFDRFLEGVPDTRQVVFVDDGWRLKTDPAEHLDPARDHGVLEPVLQRGRLAVPFFPHGSQVCTNPSGSWRSCPTHSARARDHVAFPTSGCFFACPAFTARSLASISLSSMCRWSTSSTRSVSNEKCFAAISTHLYGGFSR